MPSRLRGMGEIIAKLSRLQPAFVAMRTMRMQRAVRIVEADLKNVSLSAPRGPTKTIRSGKNELIMIGGGVGGLHSGSPRPNGAPSNLRASITAEVLPAVAGKVVGVVGTDVPWAPIHEYGGTIRPKHGPFLYIPVFVQRVGTAERRGKAGKFPVANRRRTSVIAVRSVTMPAREPFGQTQRRTEPQVRREFEDGVRDFVRVANG